MYRNLQDFYILFRRILLFFMFSLRDFVNIILYFNTEILNSVICNAKIAFPTTFWKVNLSNWMVNLLWMLSLFTLREDVPKDSCLMFHTKEVSRVVNLFNLSEKPQNFHFLIENSCKILSSRQFCLKPCSNVV